MLNYFLDQYDEEDGLIGNLKRVPICAFNLPKVSDAKIDWNIFIKTKSNAQPAAIYIDSKNNTITISGKTAGEARRAMVVFMRLIDRKYPHIGRLISLKRIGNAKPWSILENSDNRKLFENLTDKEWLLKPILNAEYEKIYSNNSMDFANKYTMRFAPYIYEPTYYDDFVYGYSEE
jgi:hypothetical protein